jgi:hypothetical protein
VGQPLAGKYNTTLPKSDDCFLRKGPEKGNRRLAAGEK